MTPDQLLAAFCLVAFAFGVAFLEDSIRETE